MVKIHSQKAPQPEASASWKKSPLLAIALTAVIAACGYYIYVACFANSGSNLIPDNFPHTFIAVKDNGNPKAILIKRGQSEPAVPFTENEKEYWQAYICQNTECPGMKKGKKYVFAYVVEAPRIDEKTGEILEPPAPPVCPLCVKAAKKAHGKDREKYENAMVERFQTPEGEKIFDDIRAKYQTLGG